MGGKQGPLPLLPTQLPLQVQVCMTGRQKALQYEFCTRLNVNLLTFQPRMPQRNCRHQKRSTPMRLKTVGSGKVWAYCRPPSLKMYKVCCVIIFWLSMVSRKIITSFTLYPFESTHRDAESRSILIGRSPTNTSLWSWEDCQARFPYHPKRVFNRHGGLFVEMKVWV